MTFHLFASLFRPRLRASSEISRRDAIVQRTPCGRFSNDAMNIEYVEYDMPGPSRMPFSAAPTKNGHVWIPNSGVANKISRLDPQYRAKCTICQAPYMVRRPFIQRSRLPDGSVWLAEQGSNKLGRWDPAYPENYRISRTIIFPASSVRMADRSTHCEFHPDGNVWASGNPLTRLDRKTKKFTRFDDVLAAYDVKEDSNGNIWFTRPDTSQIGMVDWKTLKVSLWTPPTPKSFPRRMEIDTDGIVWFGEFNAGKIGRFDPKTQTFTEYPLPGPEPTPYGLGIDADHHIWYSSYNMDVLGCFDPKTGKTIEYPFPHSENTIREFIRDAQGRMWYGSPSNNKVGYFTLTSGAEGTGNKNSTTVKLGN